jgi:hypothetical protein
MQSMHGNDENKISRKNLFTDLKIKSNIFFEIIFFIERNKNTEKIFSFLNFENHANQIVLFGIAANVFLFTFKFFIGAGFWI